MELLGLQEIVLNKDLRLLDLAEKHWGSADDETCPLVKKKDSFNMINKKVQAPIQTEVVSI